MQIIQKFYTNDSSIEFVIPDVKENMYYLPSSELNRFDLVEVIYFDNNQRIKVLDDILQEALIPFYRRLQNLCKGELNFKNIIVASMGKSCNEVLYRKTTSEEIKNLWRSLLWECGRTSAYLYQLGDQYYFEISPNYPWHFTDPKDGEQCIIFDEFIKNYRPFVLEKISYETAQEWIKKCEELIKKIL